MLYVQQSLGSDEEILLGARFHWMYTLNAVMWIVMGLMMGAVLAYGAVWFDIYQGVQANYPGLPDNMWDRAEAEYVENQGGYLKILWGQHAGVRMAILGMFIVGLFIFANKMIIKATTEIAITTDRLIIKRGLIARSVNELSVDRIEGVNVHQGIMGRIFGYGRVAVRGMGVGEVMLPPIEDPVEFRKAVQEAKVVNERGGVSLARPDEF